ALKGVVPAIASSGGQVPPIHRHFGDKKVEDVAFSLKVGDVSQLLQMPDKTWVILKCDEHLPPAKDDLNQLRQALGQEVYEHKLQAEIPKAFQELRQRAAPEI